MSLPVEISREDSASLSEYAAITIAFEVRYFLADPVLGAATLPLSARPVARPYVKDYDALNPPQEWHRHFDVRRAVFLAAFLGHLRVGGAVIIVHSGDRTRLGVDGHFGLLWDLRVAPEARRRGIGRALVEAAESTARVAGLHGIVVETQDINLPACQLYASESYELTRINPLAYRHLPDETQLIWTKMVSQIFSSSG